MPEFLAPGVYIEEVAFRAHPIEGVSTSTVGFVGAADSPRLLSGITSFVDFERQAVSGSSAYLSSAVRGFFLNGGTRCFVAPSPQLILLRVHSRPDDRLGTADSSLLPLSRERSQRPLYPHHGGGGRHPEGQRSLSWP